MHESIVVHRIQSDLDSSEWMNVSHQVANKLESMGIIDHYTNGYKVIREGDVIVTVYSYRRAV
jgi:hypothetical protein